MYNNAESVVNKITEIRKFVEKYSPDIIALTETGLKARHYDSEYQIEGFNSCRRDSNISKKAGIIIYFRKNINVKICEEFSSEEFLTCRYEVGNQWNYISCCHRLFKAPITNFDNFIRNIREICQVTRNILVVGDFNLPNISWGKPEASKNLRPNEEKLIQVINECDLIQHMRKPTRYRGIDTPHILDLVLTKQSENIKSLASHPPYGKGD